MCIVIFYCTYVKMGSVGNGMCWKTGKSQKRYISPVRGEAACKQILTTFCTSADMPDVIICADFAMEKLGGLG